MADILLKMPQAGQIITVEPQANDRIILAFSADEALPSREGDTLVFTFNNGSSIELTNFYTAFSLENMPEFVVEGSIISGEAFFAALDKDLMPAAGDTSTLQGSGISITTTEGTLREGLDSRGSVDSSQGDSESTTFSLATGEVVDTISEDSSNPDSSTGVNAPLFAALNDVLSYDAGAVLSGNLFDNDNLPNGSVITNIETPAGWSAIIDPVTGIITLSKDDISFNLNSNGDYILNTGFNTNNIANIDLKYTVQDPAGNSYSATIVIGNAGSSNLQIDRLEGSFATVIDVNTGNTYKYQFTDYSNDDASFNHHINGMLLGEGDDTITVTTAIGSQGNLSLADPHGKDTFIYGDAVNAYKQEDVGHDVINIVTLDGTKIRGDGHLHNDVVGGNDTINVEVMEHGSIIGDGWTINNNSTGGDDEINIGTMQSGEIYSDSVNSYQNSQGGNDQITVDTIDTTLAGAQSIIINAGGGNDTVTVGDIFKSTGDTIKIDGGLGTDIFNYNNDGDNTITINKNSITIDGVDASILNFEGISTNDGDDLIKLAGSFDDVFVDGGDDMDILLANFNTMNEIEDMIDNGNIVNTELIVLNNALNNTSVKNTDMLLNKLESEGVSKDANGNLKVDTSAGWTKGDSIGDFEQYTNTDNDMTILIAKVQIENSPL